RDGRRIRAHRGRIRSLAEGALQLRAGLRCVQPTLVVGNDKRRSDEPDAWLALFHEHLPPCKLFPDGDLTVRTDDLDADFACLRVHSLAGTRSCWDRAIPIARMHYSTNVRLIMRAHQRASS